MKQQLTAMGLTEMVDWIVRTTRSSPHKVGVAYRNDHHQLVRHGVGECVDEPAHINGMESFWAMLKRAHKVTCHKMSIKHLGRDVLEFAGRHNIREPDTLDQMESIISGWVGRPLKYED